MALPFDNDYSWHEGSSVSASVPQVFNRVRTSFSGQVPAGFPIRRPGRQRLLFEALAGFLALDVLRYRLVHDPVERPLPQAGQMLHAPFQFVIDLGF